MNDDDNLIDFAAERDKRVHDLKDQRLNQVRLAFERALPLPKAAKKDAKKAKNKPKK